MEIKKIYEYAEKIGVLVFSTIYKDEVHSRVAHFNGYDDEGIYFRTMINKPFYRQLITTKKVTICGITDTTIIEHKKDGTPIFPPSYSFRLIGEIKKISPKTVKEKAKTNKDMLTAAQDIEKYPAMAEGNFVIYKAKVEIFDVDFEKVNREHKVLRTRVAFGGATFNLAGVHINDNCIECDLCKETCSFDAINEGTPYTIDGSRCDDCGNCLLVCPVKAIEESLVF